MTKPRAARSKRSSMIAVSEEIYDEIERACGQARGAPVDITVLACRYTHADAVLSNFAARAPHSKVIRALRFAIYYADEQYLKSNLDKSFHHTVDGLQKRMDKLKMMLIMLEQVIEAKLLPYKNPPSIWAFKIADRCIFWAPFVADGDHVSGRYYVGPTNPCVVIRKRERLFRTYASWVSGIAKDYERLYSESPAAAGKDGARV